MAVRQQTQTDIGGTDPIEVISTPVRGQVAQPQVSPLLRSLQASSELLNSGVSLLQQTSRIDTQDEIDEFKTNRRVLAEKRQVMNAELSELNDERIEQARLLQEQKQREAELLSKKADAQREQTKLQSDLFKRRNAEVAEATALAQANGDPVALSNNIHERRVQLQTIGNAYASEAETRYSAQLLDPSYAAKYSPEEHFRKKSDLVQQLMEEDGYDDESSELITGVVNSKFAASVPKFFSNVAQNSARFEQQLAVEANDIATRQTISSMLSNDLDQAGREEIWNSLMEENKGRRKNVINTFVDHVKGKVSVQGYDNPEVSAAMKFIDSYESNGIRLAENEAVRGLRSSYLSAKYSTDSVARANAIPSLKFDFDSNNDILAMNASLGDVTTDSGAANYAEVYRSVLGGTDKEVANAIVDARKKVVDAQENIANQNLSSAALEQIITSGSLSNETAAELGVEQGASLDTIRAVFDERIGTDTFNKTQRALVSRLSDSLTAQLSTTRLDNDGALKLNRMLSNLRNFNGGKLPDQFSSRLTIPNNIDEFKTLTANMNVLASNGISSSTIYSSRLDDAIRMYNRYRPQGEQMEQEFMAKVSSDEFWSQSNQQALKDSVNSYAPMMRDIIDDISEDTNLDRTDIASIMETQAYRLKLLSSNPITEESLRGAVLEQVESVNARTIDVGDTFTVIPYGHSVPSEDTLERSRGYVEYQLIKNAEERYGENGVKAARDIISEFNPVYVGKLGRSDYVLVNGNTGEDLPPNILGDLIPFITKETDSSRSKKYSEILPEVEAINRQEAVDRALNINIR